MKVKVAAFLFFSLFFPSVVLAYYNPGAPSGYVSDYASMLSTAAKTQLEQELSDFEKETKHEIAVVTIPDLQGDTIENFAVKLFEEWGIGKKGADNGVLFLIAKNDRQMRIEVGYGLEGALPDATAWQIIDKIATPAFKNGDYDNGVVQAVKAIKSAVAGEEIGFPVESKKFDGSMAVGAFKRFGYVIFILLFLVLEACAYFLSKSKRWWPGGLWGAGIGLAAGWFLFSSLIGIGILTVIFTFIGLIVDYKASKKGPKGWWDGGSGRRGGFGGGMFSSGGFRDRGGFGGGGRGFGGFGGGGSGGGGSSGRW